VAAAQSGRITRAHVSKAFDHIARVKSVLSPPFPFNESTIAKLRDRIAELNVALHQ
jgi:hypothetical protein